MDTAGRNAKGESSGAKAIELDEASAEGHTSLA